MAHVCVKCGVTIKCAKDERKGTWMTERATQHVKKRTSENHRHSIDAYEPCAKEDTSKKRQHLISSTQARFTLLN